MFEQPLRDEGTYFDKETGLLYNMNRYRDLNGGRFVQADPSGLCGGDLSLYVLRRNDPLRLTDPDGRFVNFIAGAFFGAGLEVTIQAYKNYRDGCDIFDLENYDWADVGVSAAVGALAPGVINVGKTIVRSGGAIKTLGGQLDRARTASRAAKIEGRIQQHRAAIADIVTVQGAFQGAKAAGKSVNGDQGKQCGCRQQ